MDIKTIVFDFGKVVGFFDHRLTTNRLLAHTRLTADELHASLFGSALEEDYESGRISTADFVHSVRESCQLSCTDDFISSALADIFWPNPDVCELVPRLSSNYRLLLASNTNELHAGQFLGQFADAFRYFHHIVLSHKIGVRKPRAAFFAHCLEIAQCAPGECLFIDDLQANVAGAVDCGWNGIVYTNFDDLVTRLAALDILGLEKTPAFAKKKP